MGSRPTLGEPLYQQKNSINSGGSRERGVRRWIGRGSRPPHRETHFLCKWVLLTVRIEAADEDGHDLAVLVAGQRQAQRRYGGRRSVQVDAHHLALQVAPSLLDFPCKKNNNNKTHQTLEEMRRLEN